MKIIIQLLTHPIIRKIMMGLTGAFLVFFVCIHLAGNYLFFVGADTFNAYGRFLNSIPILPVIEIVLLLAAIYHASVGVFFKFFDPMRARDRNYAIRRNAPNSRRNFASRTVHYSGLVILVFLVYHVWTMKYGEPGIAQVDRDLFAYCLEVFSSLPIVIGYVVVLLVIGVHLFHGLGTLYETFGIAHRSWLRLIGQAFAILLMALYVIYPILVYIYGANL